MYAKKVTYQIENIFLFSWLDLIGQDFFHFTAFLTELHLNTA